MHVYTQAQQWAEPYISFEFAGAGHIGYLDNTASNRWGYLPERTSRYAMGASQFYDGEVFGSDSTRLARNVWEIAGRTREMLRKALDYAGNQNPGQYPQFPSLSGTDLSARSCADENRELRILSRVFRAISFPPARGC
jgi:hypothetical protein